MTAITHLDQHTVERTVPATATPKLTGPQRDTLLRIAELGGEINGAGRQPGISGNSVSPLRHHGLLEPVDDCPACRTRSTAGRTTAGRSSEAGPCARPLRGSQPHADVCRDRRRLTAAGWDTVAALLADTLIGDRRLSDYQHTSAHTAAESPTAHTQAKLVGYVVEHTQRDGQPTWRHQRGAPGSPDYLAARPAPDVAVFPNPDPASPDPIAAAEVTRDALADWPASWAVVRRLYTCGCRR